MTSRNPKIEKPDLLKDKKPRDAFDEYYEKFLEDHANEANKWMHFLGSVILVGGVAFCAITMQPIYLAAVIPGSFIPNGVGHYFFEGNFGNERKDIKSKWYYPFISQFKMNYEMLTGKL
jgi:hypothetical protein